MTMGQVLLETRRDAAQSSRLIATSLAFLHKCIYHKRLTGGCQTICMDAAYEPPSYWHVTGTPVAPDPVDWSSAAEVVVVGGGLLGVSTAYWLACAGVAVALIERAAIAAGATGRNGGLVVAGAAEAYPALIRRVGQPAARALWSLTLQSQMLLRAVLAEEAIACDYREPGCLSLALDATQLAALVRSTALLRADGFSAELLDRSQTQALIATPLSPTICGGFFLPTAGLLHSARLIQGLAQAARRYGARIYEATAVTQVSRDGAGLRVQTDRGPVRAEAVIVAANAWTDLLVPELAGVVVPVRGQMLAYAPVVPLFTTGMAANVTPTGEYWQQTSDGTILLGGCRAAAPDSDVNARSAQPTELVQAALEQVFPRLFPALGELRVVQRWAGLMAFTPDYLPIADRVPGLPHAWVVGGFSGHGVPFGMRMGQLLAEAVIADSAPAALAPFRRDRPTLIVR
jgi:gamma-glutamylputrescine oxidase